MLRYRFSAARASSHVSMIIAASCAGGRLSSLAMRTSSALAVGVSRIVSVSDLFSMSTMYSFVLLRRNVYLRLRCV